MGSVRDWQSRNSPGCCPGRRIPRLAWGNISLEPPKGSPPSFGEAGGDPTLHLNHSSRLVPFPPHCQDKSLFSFNDEASPTPRGRQWAKQHGKRGGHLPHPPRMAGEGGWRGFHPPQRVPSSPSPAAGSQGLLTFVPVVVELVELLRELRQRLLDGLRARHRQRKPPLEVFHLVHLPSRCQGGQSPAGKGTGGSGGWVTLGWCSLGSEASRPEFLPRDC